MTVLLVALAGGLGGASRFLMDTWVARHNRLSVPLGTVLVNATACFLLGLLVGILSTHLQWQAFQQILGVGFLGGYSTFSTASVESATLVRQRRYAAATLLAGGMFLLSLVALLAGLLVGSWM